MLPLVKRPLEARTYTFVFCRLPEISVNGDTIASVTGITGQSDLTLGATSIVNVTDTNGITYPSSGVAVKISAGTDQTTYEMLCTVVTTLGATLTCQGTLFVGNPRTQ